MGALPHHKIRDFRKRKGMTMQALAEVMGTSQQQIDRLEKGQRRLTIDWLERLSRALDCSALELLPASLQRDCGTRTAKAKVIGEVSGDGVIRWWPEEDRYTLVFGRPEEIKNARFFAVKVANGGDATGFSLGTELVFSEVGDDSVNPPENQAGWVICAHSGGEHGQIHCVEKIPSGRDVKAIRARLVKSLRNE